MLPRTAYLETLATALRRSPIAALLGPRQCGKTTLARQFCLGRAHFFYDCESPVDQARLANPELELGPQEGLVVLDEIQTMPHLFAVLRVLVDRAERKTRFLLLGSAAPSLVKGAAETLAGRIEFIEVSGFDCSEVEQQNWQVLWQRGGFPRSYLADNDQDSAAWREGFVRTFLERDLPQLGINIPAPAMRRFWTMLAHLHGQRWNGNALGRAMGLSDKTVRSYLDILSATFMLRQLQPWSENIGKRQVKAPKLYFQDSGLLHHLLHIPDRDTLLAHPKLGASFEGFAIEQAIHLAKLKECYTWAVHSGAELDLLFFANGKRYGLEIKHSEAPPLGKSAHSALADLALDHLWIIAPCPHRYKLNEQATVWPVADLPGWAKQFAAIPFA